jgi:hypothetical protein
LGPNILLSTLFSKTLSLHSSLNVSDQLSQPYKTTGKIIHPNHMANKLIEEEEEEEEETRLLKRFKPSELTTRFT